MERKINMTPNTIAVDENTGKTGLALYREPQTSREIPPLQNRREMFRMNLQSIEKLSAILTLPDNTSVYTIIRDLSAGGFSCQLNGLVRFDQNNPIMIAFALHRNETITFRAPVAFGCITQAQGQIVYRFKFEAEMEEIHCYLLKKQIELIRKERFEKLV